VRGGGGPARGGARPLSAGGRGLGGGPPPAPHPPPPPPPPTLQLWLQVADAAAAHEELRAAGAEILRPPVQEPWGLIEMWIADPDGHRLVLVQIPADHPLRYRPGI
ncbi:VOC family protein, partial [Streptomyces qinglanensis]|uniref:VOC family protein n=1 Tax=Streptomyces qinglanensis TaxID=943816 RepID=UPI00378A3487